MNAFTLAEITLASRSLVVVITPDTPTAIRLEHECPFFMGAGNSLPILLFPDWETLPYDRISPHADIISQRLSILYQLQTLKRGLLLVPAPTLCQVLPPLDYLNQFTFILKKGELFNLSKMTGYLRVEQVLTPGEFAVRGSLLDVFPMGSKTPYRIDLIDNEVDSIRTFDVDSQRSIAPVEEINLLPAREFPTNQEGINQFKTAWRDHFPGLPTQYPDYVAVTKQQMPAGIEYYLPLFFKQTANFFDYLPKDSETILLDNWQPAIGDFWQNVNHRYEQLRHDVTRPILSPEKLFLTSEKLPDLQRATSRSPLQEIEAPPSFSNQKHPLPDFSEFLKTCTARVLLTVETPGRREVLSQLLKQQHLFPHLFNNWQEFLSGKESLGLIVAPLELGFVLKEPSIIVFTETELFGEHIQQRRLRKQRKEPDAVVRNLAELQIGSPVVHVDHGIGKYVGLQALHIDNQASEFLVLEYAETAKLYVPITSLNLIHRYIGTEDAALHRLGNEKWQKEKEAALKRIHDVAAELLEIYAKRAAHEGTRLNLPPEYALFAASFPFEETPDQQITIQKVIEDMTSPRLMDRLVCGDVGFGKTEVALRAAFISVQNNQQVALLTPTTLLTQQHYQTFLDRFADWPVKIEVLSRFRTRKEQLETLKALADGKVDIVIGTHRLLQPDVKFKNLGLLVVDEEHRFGVKHKEKIKSLRSEIDILTLTATPIPRTLNMTMSGIRDLSLITTPPLRRLSIKTFVREYDANLIREAIEREHHRGGQVYFLHNDIESIEKMVRDIQTLLPEATIAVAHGQMHERQLERIMADFYHRRYNVLVCTTIIESGIDVPTANTILINRADKLGLSQLHQLRGRVGRSHHQAYAYLFVPPEKNLSADAEKRLEAIQMFEELGAGFQLAMHDMEIRGVGELLGEDQSGQVQTIGYTLYTELLEKTVESIKSGKHIDLKQPLKSGPEIHCPVTALIPETTIPDIHTRLIQYKRLAHAKTQAELDELQVEFIDRFGLLTPPLKNLFAITEFKLKAETLGIQKIDFSQKGGTIAFQKNCPIDPNALLRLITLQPKRFRLQGSYQLKILGEWKTEQTILDEINNCLDKLKECRV